MTEQDQELFSQIYYQYYKRLLYAAIHIVHNFSIAEELTNETFTILLAQFAQSNPFKINLISTLLSLP